VTILYYYLTGFEVLVDPEINLSAITLPLVGYVLAYTILTFFLFVIYFIAYDKIRRSQQEHYEEFKRSQNNLAPTADSSGIGLCSIIVAARNEESVIRKTVLDALRQTYKNIEVVVVCHNCSDKTYEQAQIDTDNRVRALDFRTEEAGKGIALNYGVKMSRGEYIMILDADGLLSDDFIEKALPLLKGRIAAAQGRYVPSNRDYSLVTKLLSLEGDLWSTPYMTTRGFIDKRGGLGGTGYIIRRNILIEVGGFANHLVDDYELTTRLLKSKYRILFAPLCINYDEKPPSLDIMLRQRARWAKGFIDMLQRNAVERTDIISALLWLNPVAAILGLTLLFIIGFAATFNIIFGYFPYYYSSINTELWLALTAALFFLQGLTLVKMYGKKGVRYGLYIPLYNIFSLYFFVTFIKAFRVKSWGSTKTMHGFTKTNIQKNP
jgi:poly-beta-1,6-N-acetyl-D-glucosamine synthase